MRLSVYTICLNDDEWIEQALRYAAAIADEVVVVDGGSTDSTMGRTRAFRDSERLEDAGVWIYERPMPDSFAVQRNFALDQCHGDWILQLDADEKYTRPLREWLLPALDGVPAEVLAFSFPTYHLCIDERHHQTLDNDPHIRLFRNDPALRYKGAIHEHLAFEGEDLIAHPSHFRDLERRIVRYQPEVRLLHYGSLRSDRAWQAWRDRWQRFAEASAAVGIDVNAKVRHPKAIGEIPEEELP